MHAIVGVDEAWGIGRENRLLFSVPEDMAFFKETTGGKVVVMGRKTLESLPGGAALKNRINIVLTGDKTLKIKSALTCHSLGQLWGALGLCPAQDIYVMGGQAVYAQLLSYCEQALVTRYLAAGGADTFFPNLDADKNWVLAAQGGVKTHGGLSYRFCTYENLNVRPLPGV